MIVNILWKSVKGKWLFGCRVRKMDYNTHALSLSSCARGVASRLHQAQNLRRHPFSGLCGASLVLASDASLAHPDSGSASGHDRHDACVEKCMVGLSATSFIHGWIHVSLVNYLLSGILFLFMHSVVAAINPIQSHAGRHRDGKKKHLNNSLNKFLLLCIWHFSLGFLQIEYYSYK